jgi:hypothetical protein
VEERFHQFMNDLPITDRLILLLRALEEMTFKSIGYILNLSESRVLQRYHRILQRLRQFLLEFDDERDDTPSGRDSTDSKDSTVRDDSSDDPQDASKQQSEEP